MNIFMFILLFSFPFSAYSDEAFWEKVFGSKGTSNAFSINNCKEGGYIVAGWKNPNNPDSNSKGGFDAWVLRLSDTGSIIWDKTFGGSNTDTITSIEQTSDGGFIFAGWTESTDGDIRGNHGGSDAWIVKLTNNGNIEWSKVFGDINKNSAYSIHETKDGGFIFAGETKNNNGDNDAWLVKLKRSGDIDWEQSFGGDKEDAAYSVQETNDGAFVMAGWSNSSKSNMGAWILKTNCNGNNVLWEKNIGENEYDALYSIYVTNDNSIVVAGQTISKNGNKKALTALFDKNGNEIWVRTFGASNNNWASHIRETKDNNYIFTGQVTINEDGTTDAWVVKLAQDGNILWQRRFGGRGNEQTRCIIQKPDKEGYIFTGWTNTPPNDDEYSVGSTYYWIVKFNDTTTPIADLASIQNDITIYPNPTSGTINISSSNDYKQEVRVFNILGQMVYKGQLLKKETQIDLSSYPKGTYFIKTNNKKGSVVLLD